MSEISEDTIDLLENRIDQFIKEMRPEEGHLFTSTELMPIYKKKLEEYSELIFGKVNQGYVNEELAELERNLTPAAIDATDGSDDILAGILEIELAKIIYDNNEIKNPEELDNESKAIAAHRLAMQFLFNKGGDGAFKKVIAEFRKNIYRDASKEDHATQNSGCLVFLIGLSGLVLYLI